jgi:5-methylcytosine-specific restriction protein A
MSTKWTEEEIKYSVEAYLRMLKYQQNKSPFVKAEINRQLQGKIERKRGSIEKRFQNISSVLHAHGLPFVQGYVPLDNVGPTNRELIWKLFQQLNNQ